MHCIDSPIVIHKGLALALVPQVVRARCDLDGERYAKDTRKNTSRAREILDEDY